MAAAAPVVQGILVGQSSDAPAVPMRDFAAQVRAQAYAHAAAGAASGKHRRCALIALGLHIVLAIFVAAMSWVLYFALRATASSTPYPSWYHYPADYKPEVPWPMFVNWIIMVVVLGSPLFTFVSILPMLSSCRVGPAWSMIIVGNLIVANVMLWIVYALSACQVYSWGPYATHDSCDFPWPLCVSAASVCVVAVTSAIACVTGRPQEPLARDIEVGAAAHK